MNLAKFNLNDYTRDEAFAVQRELARRGFYKVEDIDGDFGPDSRKALAAARKADDGGNAPTGPAQRPSLTVAPSPATSLVLTDADRAPLDARSEAMLATLHPAVQPIMRAALNRFNAHPEVQAAGLVGVYTSGTRTYAEQQALFDKHDGTTGASAGFSSHNHKMAVDMTLFRGKAAVYEHALYKLYGAIGKLLSLVWGGDWKRDDQPHLEFHPAWSAGMSEAEFMNELRRRHESGVDLLAA